MTVWELIEALGWPLVAFLMAGRLAEYRNKENRTASDLRFVQAMTVLVGLTVIVRWFA